jgi:hypothetical protein
MVDREIQLASNPFFAGLVVVAGGQYPIPSRTRPLNSPAPMVLSLKTWKSRSLPGLRRTDFSSSRFTRPDTSRREENSNTIGMQKNRRGKPRRFFYGAGTSLPPTLLGGACRADLKCALWRRLTLDPEWLQTFRTKSGARSTNPQRDRVQPEMIALDLGGTHEK